MKINLILTYKSSIFDGNGGVETFISDLISDGIDLKKFNIRVICCTKGKSRIIQKKGVTFFLYKALFTIASTPFSIGYIMNFKKHADWADVIHNHFPWPFFDFLNFIFDFNKPIVVTYHSDVVKQKFLNIFYNFFVMRSFSKAFKLVATSNNYLSSSLILSKNEFKKKCLIIPLAIKDLHSFPSNNDIHAVLKKYGLKSKTYVIFIGVLRYYKNVSLLLEAAPYINADILIVGDGPFKFACQKIITNQNIKNVHLLGSVSEADKSALLNLSSLLVLPSHLRSEAFGMVLLEASMHGKPMVTLDIATGTSFVNLDNKTGFVLKSNNFIKLSLAINKILSDSSLAREMGKNARCRFDKFFKKQTMIRKYERLYKYANKSFQN
jgi:glycosyltransferase involved in cell wall biosynthesis